MKIRTPRVATAILWMVLPRAEREFLLGDLEEQFRQRCELNRINAWLWYWRQLIRLRPLKIAVAARQPPSAGTRRFTFYGDSIFHDLKYAVRFLRKSPKFTVAAAAILTLGIGSNTALFSVAHGVLLRPLPYHEPGRLVAVGGNTGKDLSLGYSNVSEPEFLDLATEISSFQQVAAYNSAELTIGDSSRARRISVMRVTTNLLPMLGVSPWMGRLFNDDEGQPDGEDAIVLSHAMWQREFGADPDIIGSTISLRDIAATWATQYELPVPVVGIMPPSFRFPDAEYEAWVPLKLDTQDPHTRSFHYLNSIARLEAGTSLAAAQNEVNVLAARTTSDFPDVYASDPGYTIRIQPYLDRIVGHVSTSLYLLMGAVGFVLLMACVNVANLVLVRGEARKSEIAIRTAVGASSGRVMRQLLIENVLLVSISGLCGACLAILGLNTIRTIASKDVPRLDQIGIDGRVFVLSAAIALAFSLAFAVFPVVRDSRGNRQRLLTHGRRSSGTGRSSSVVRRLLVVVEVTFAVVLATGAGLMLRSIHNMHVTDTGFRIDNVLTLPLYPPTDTYGTEQSRVALYSELTDRLNTVPGVASAGAIFRLPLASGHFDMSIDVDDYPVESIADAQLGDIQFATQGVFDALGIRLVRGRLFDTHDDADAPLVVLVSESLASTAWRGENPVGRRMRMFGWPWMEVIGVVEDVRHYGVAQDPRPAWYVPHAQGYVSAYTSPQNMTIVVQGEVDPLSLVGPVRESLTSVDPGIVVSQVRTMEEVYGAALNTEHLVTVLLTVFGVLAFSLAAVGVYGLISLTVSQRTHEIGLRMALGAASSKVLRHTMGEGLLLTLAGLVFGICGSVVLSRGIESLVFGITPTDPLTYSAVIVLLLAAAAGASWFPARRASRVDPVAALKSEA
jgi:predicted permease